MKQGMSLQALAAEIERRANAKRDLVAPTSSMQISDTGDKLLVGQSSENAFELNEIAHGQIAEHVKVPKNYYDLMRGKAPELLKTNVDHWFAKYPAERLVRTLDGRARAFLSDRYRPLENEDLCTAVLPVMMEQGLDILSCEVTERRLYIKAVDSRIQRDVPSGRKIGDGSHVFFDTVSPAITISNSEVGYGRLVIDYGVYTAMCTNMATIASAGMKRTHVGSKLEALQNFEAKLTDETRQAKDRALWLEARDVVKAAFQEAQFEAITSKMKGLVEQKIDGDVVKTVSFATKRLGMVEDEGKAILDHLIKGGDFTHYGFFNAVTRTAQDLPDYDRATELEYVGGRLLDLPANDWRDLTRVAA